MKYLIVSDSHGIYKKLMEVIVKVSTKDSPITAMFHVGDLGCSLSRMEEIAECPVYAVSGNCDFSDELDDEKIAIIEGHRIAMCHGHRHGVKNNLELLITWGMRQEVEMIMFGHTHIPVLLYEQGMTLVNPGSISMPRQEPYRVSYTIMEIDNNNEIHFTMNYVD